MSTTGGTGSGARDEASPVAGRWAVRLGRRPRVVFLAWRDLGHPQAGGSELLVDRLATGLGERDWDVTLLAGGPVTRHPYPAWSLGGTYDQYLRAPFVHRRRVRSVDVVVDVVNGVPYWSPWWQRAPVVGLVTHIHTDQWAMQFPGPVAALGRVLEGRLMPRAYRRAEWAAISASTAAGLAGVGVDPARISVIELGVDPVATTGPRAPEPRFLVLGRVVPHKRVEIALRAWPEVRARTGGTLVVAGDGPDLERLRALAGDGVEFTGFLSEADKARELGAAWALVHPAHHEGWGLVVMEAAGAGVPTVAFDVEGVRDSVVPGETGILAADEREFVAGWIALGTDTARRTAMADAARTRAASYTWARTVDGFEGALDRALGGRPGPPRR